MGWQPGDPLHVVCDDTQKRKRGKLMEAVSKIFLHTEKVYAQGHTILGCTIVYRDVVIPYAVRLWANRAFCEQTQKKSYDDDPIAVFAINTGASLPNWRPTSLLGCP